MTVTEPPPSHPCVPDGGWALPCRYQFHTGLNTELSTWNCVHCRTYSSMINSSPGGLCVSVFHPKMSVCRITMESMVILDLWRLHSIISSIMGHQTLVRLPCTSSIVLTCSSLSRMVIGVRFYEGLAGPAGQPVLCMCLIKHSFLNGAPASCLPSFFHSSRPHACDAQWAH